MQVNTISKINTVNINTNRTQILPSNSPVNNYNQLQTIQDNQNPPINQTIPTFRQTKETQNTTLKQPTISGIHENTSRNKQVRTTQTTNRQPTNPSKHTSNKNLQNTTLHTNTNTTTLNNHKLIQIKTNKT